MLFELRIYRCMPGKLPAVLTRFEKSTIGIWKDLGIEPVGFWTTVIGNSSRELFYMLRWKSLAEREEKWARFLASPEWARVRADTERNGALIECVSNSILESTSFSPM